MESSTAVTALLEKLISKSDYSSLIALATEKETWGTPSGYFVPQVYIPGGRDGRDRSTDDPGNKNLAVGQIIPAILVTPDNYGYIRDSKSKYYELAKRGIILSATASLVSKLRAQMSKQQLKNALSFITAHNQKLGFNYKTEKPAGYYTISTSEKLPGDSAYKSAVAECIKFYSGVPTLLAHYQATQKQFDDGLNI